MNNNERIARFLGYTKYPTADYWESPSGSPVETENLSVTTDINLFVLAWNKAIKELYVLHSEASLVKSKMHKHVGKCSDLFIKIERL